MVLDNRGVVYKWQIHNKINGSVYYAAEYFLLLKDYLNINLYIIDCPVQDQTILVNALNDKYHKFDINCLKFISCVELYSLNLFKTLILDIRTFYSIRFFLTNKIYCFSNERHEKFRYKNNREVTYFGSYNYQNFDKFCYLKLNFKKFKKIEQLNNKVFISSRTHDTLDYWYYQNKYFIPDNKILKKRNDSTINNLFENIDTIIYVHTKLDTNNRIIPEAYYFNKKIIIDDQLPDTIDSISLRYNDIIENGLINYSLTIDDIMIQEMLNE